MSLQASRALAHQLYGQCRDSPGAYKLLAPSVRKLRNLLEEVEESVDSGSAVGPHESGIDEQAARCHNVLTRLEMGMQPHEYYSSPTNHVRPSEDAIADLRTAIDVACHQLSVAYDASSSKDGIPLRLETNSWSTMPSHKAKSASVSATSDDTRKLSTSSSAWSLVQPESSTGGSTIDEVSATTSPALKSRSSEEKQVCSPTSTTSAGGSAVSCRVSGWASTFALDPLSIPMDQATAFILSEDNPATSDRSHLSPGGPAVSSGKPEDFHADRNSINRKDQDPAVYETSGATTLTPNVSLSYAPEVEHPAVSDDLDTKPITLRPTSLQRFLMSTGSALPKNTLDVHGNMVPNTRHNRSLSVGDTASTGAEPSLATVSRDDSAQLPFISTTAGNTSTESKDPARTAPQPPRRAPPPPPSPRRTRSRNASIGRYVIANLTPLDNEASDDSDEDLYTTSRPASPKSARGEVVHQQPQSGSIPEVRIDGSACEEGDAPLTPAIPSSVTATERDSTPPVIPDISREALGHEDGSTTHSVVYPEKEVLDHQAPTIEPMRAPPPLPKRPVRYHSLRSAPAVPHSRSAPLIPTHESQTLDGLQQDNHLQTGTKKPVLKERRSVSEALNDILTTGDGSTSRWSWQRRSRSRSELDHTQMPVSPPPQRQRSHSSLAKLIRDEVGGAAQVRPSVVAVESAPQLLGMDDRPPPVPPRPRLSSQTGR
ncbi:hypothetical protein B0A55_11002 [Friedmanniomyces simplex]|uniref:Uncharacterized protein n=1 Tax=Friedmanniomyces simplex TaxID=329884 RepID=A0A4U0WEM3_9PEZI|nr:hypothetical protein B0A55_10825 [Friedmanniomyces simplex]TKA61250.1 hypothetical protein B0A55_11002 [Friedmanniomyces simplex]